MPEVPLNFNLKHYGYLSLSHKSLHNVLLFQTWMTKYQAWQLMFFDFFQYENQPYCRQKKDNSTLAQMRIALLDNTHSPLLALYYMLSFTRFPFSKP